MSDWLDGVEAELVRLKSGQVPDLGRASDIRLRPIGANPSADDAALLATWRNDQPRAFFTWIESTAASTQRWLSGVYGPDRLDILVVLEDAQGVPFGHLGLVGFSEDEPGGRTCELVRVLRGTSGGPRGAMSRAIEHLVGWAVEALGVETVVLEVFADNAPAIACYERCGFELVERWGLTRTDAPNMVRWTRAAAGAPSDAWAVTMAYSTSKRCAP